MHFCGISLLPCKSLKYLTDRRMPLTHHHTIKVMHVEGKFLEYESTAVEGDLRLVGIKGTPIFSQNCKPFLNISQGVGVEKRHNREFP